MPSLLHAFLLIAILIMFPPSGGSSLPTPTTNFLNDLPSSIRALSSLTCTMTPQSNENGAIGYPSDFAFFWTERNVTEECYLVPFYAAIATNGACSPYFLTWIRGPEIVPYHSVSYVIATAGLETNLSVTILCHNITNVTHRATCNSVYNVSASKNSYSVILRSPNACVSMTPEPSQSPPTAPPPAMSSRTAAIVGSIVATVLGMVLFVVGLWWHRSRRGLGEQTSSSWWGRHGGSRFELFPGGRRYSRVSNTSNEEENDIIELDDD